MTMSFNHLWQFACREAHRQNTTPQSVFAPVGLLLEPPTQPWRYYCTPKNVRTFASSGRDGVHYSLLSSRHLPYSPVIMTVPMSFETPNIVLAETLHEFLCLGCRASYLNLEALTSVDGNFSALKTRQYAKQLSPLQTYQLQRLSTAFTLYPYVDLERRMAQLQAQYLDYVQLGEREALPLPALASTALF